MSNKYRDYLGRVLFVSSAPPNGTTWMTVYEKPNGSTRRVKSRFLPLRTDRHLAQRDLDLYAERRGMTVAQ